MSIENGRPQRKPGSSRKEERAYTAKELEAIRQDLALLRRRRKEDEALREEGADVILLCEALSNIVSSKRSPLKTLSLRIRTHRGETVKQTTRPPPSPWRSKQSFKAAISTYNLMMQSLRSSQLKVQALDIFFSWPGQLECSVPCDVLGNTDLSTGLRSCLSILQVFSVSITDPMVNETKYENSSSEGEENHATVARSRPVSTRDQISSERNYSAISSMLQSCPQLQELNIVAYPLNCSKDAEELARLQNSKRDRHMHYLARAPPLSQLRKLSLAGLKMHDADLLTFLQSHVSSLCELELIDIRLPERSFRPITEYVTGGETTRLIMICFYNIREGKDLIHFRSNWEEEGFGAGQDRDFVRRWGVGRKGDVEYFGSELRVMGGAATWEWTLEEVAREEEEDGSSICEG